MVCKKINKLMPLGTVEQLDLFLFLLFAHQFYPECSVIYFWQLFYTNQVFVALRGLCVVLAMIRALSSCITFVVLLLHSWQG